MHRYITDTVRVEINYYHSMNFRKSHGSHVKFRNVASRKDKIVYVTYNDSLTNYSKCTWVGFLTIGPKHDYIVKGSVTLCTKDGRTFPVLEATSHEDT